MSKEGGIILSEEFDSQPYNKSIFMTTHNSYRWSLTKQLDHGIRAFELDIHDTWNYFKIILWTIAGRNYKGNFKVGHLWAGNEVPWGRRILWGNNLEKWLEEIGKWSRDHKEHAPITVFLDLKKDLIDWNNSPTENFGLVRLNEQICNAIGKDRLFTPQHFKPNSPPRIGELRNKVIVVLMSFHIHSDSAREKMEKGQNYIQRGKGWIGRRIKNIALKVVKWVPPEIIHMFIDFPGAFKTRIAYQEWRIKSDTKFDPICWVAFNPDDQKQPEYEASLEKNSLFVTAFTPEDFPTYQKNNQLVRTDYNKEEKSWPRPFPNDVNFPATDDWKEKDGYHRQTDWVKDKWMKWWSVEAKQAPVV